MVIIGFHFVHRLYSTSKYLHGIVHSRKTHDYFCGTFSSNTPGGKNRRFMVRDTVLRLQ